MPADPFEHARALWFEEYADSDFITLAGRNIFLPIVLNQLRGKPADIAGAQSVAKEKLPPFLDYLDRSIAGREFYVGKKMTVADISIASPFINLKHAGYSLDAKRWPSLNEFVERLHARPSFKKLYEEEKPIFHKPVAGLTS
jgi:glutathione S-transferase